MRLLNRTAPQFDEHLTYFTVSEADAFRRLVAQSFVRAGRDVDVYPDRLEDRGGTVFQLWNIGELCRGEVPAAWPSLIDEHVRLVTTPAQHLEDLSPEQVGAGLYLRLVEALAVPDPDLLGYARVVAPGLLEVLSVDLPDSVATPSREELAARGPIGELVALGRENLRSLLTSDAVRAEPVEIGGRTRFTSVTGDSVFTASLALLLDETVARFTGEDDWGRGFLVAIPSRHRLCYRPIDTSDAAPALEHMIEAALRGFGSEPGSLSPDVYWVRQRAWVQVTSYASGKPKVLRGTGLRDALKGL